MLLMQAACEYEDTERAHTLFICSYTYRTYIDTTRIENIFDMFELRTFFSLQILQSFFHAF